MKRKIIIILILLVSVLVVLIGLYWTNHAKYYPKQVLWLPDGFVNLKEVSNDAKDIMKYVFFEEYIS